MTVDSYICPSCGSEVKVGARCPGCAPRRKRKRVGAGPKERKPWEQEAGYDGLDLPDEAFDYDAFVTREFAATPPRKVGIKWYWWVTAVVLVVLMGWAVLAGLF